MVTTYVKVETLVLGPMSFVAEMPFSRKERLVAVALQFLGDGYFLVG